MIKPIEKSDLLKLKEYLLISSIFPGQKIGIYKIRNELTIGLTPLREVLLQLVSEGFLSHEKNKGFFVPEISRIDAEELYEVRELIEPYMAAKASKVITKGQLQILRELINQYKPRESEQYSRDRLHIDKNFHMELMNIANNSRLANAVNNTYDLLIMRRKLDFLPAKRPLNAYKEHERIYKYLKNGDSKGVFRAMQTHIRNAKQLVLGDLYSRIDLAPEKRTPWLGDTPGVFKNPRTSVL